jgi:glycosyltransferase involved in cell wall biosynthesis
VGQGALADVTADLLLTVHGRRFPHALLKGARGIRAKAVWLVDEPQEVDLSERYSRHFDIVLTNDRNTCGVHGPHKTWYLPLAADPGVHRPAETQRRKDAEGTREATGHREHREHREESGGREKQRNGEQEDRFGFSLSEASVSSVAEGSSLSASSATSVAEDIWDVCFAGGILPERAALLHQAYHLAPDISWRIVGPNRWHQPVSFRPAWDSRPISQEEYASALRSACIVLDIPRDETVSFAGRTNRRGIPATGVGCRPFEATACGRFLLSDDSRADIFSLFPHGSVGIYRAGDAADLAAQVHYWLEHAEEREERAALARAHCLREHTYAVRVRQLVDVVQVWLDTRLPGKASSPRRTARPPRSEGPKK